MWSDLLSADLLSAAGPLGLVVAHVVLWGEGGWVVQVVLTPEVALALESTHQPAWKKTTPELVGPWLLELLVVWNNATTSTNLDEPDENVDGDVGDDATDETVGDRVGERHDGESEESWESVAKVFPIDVLCSLAHHATNNDQGTAGSPWWDRGKDWREEDGDKEAETGNHGSDTSLTTLGNTSSGLNESSDWGKTEDGTNGDAESIDQVGNSGTLEILGNWVDGTCEMGHGVESTGAVHDINVKEGDESETELRAGVAKIPFDNVESLLDRVESGHLLEEVECGVSSFGVWEVSDIGVSWPGDDGNQSDTSNDGTLNTVDEQESSKHTTAEDTDPHLRRAHLDGGWADTVDHVFGKTTSKLERSGSGTGNKSDTCTVRKTDKSC